MTPTLLRAEYEAGATVRDLRRRLGAGADRVLRLLAEAETPMRRRGPRPTLATDICCAEARARAGYAAGRAVSGTLPDRLGHEWRDCGSLAECHLCGAVAGTVGAGLACEGSAAEPMSMEAHDD